MILMLEGGEETNIWVLWCIRALYSNIIVPCQHFYLFVVVNKAGVEELWWYLVNWGLVGRASL